MGGDHRGRGRAGGVLSAGDDPEVPAEADDGQVWQEGQARHDAPPLHRPGHVRLHEPPGEFLQK